MELNRYIWCIKSSMIKIASHILLVVLVLVASSGIAIDRHLCMGELQSISVLGASKSCSQQSSMDCANHQNTDDESSKKGCCDNETEYVSGIDLQVTLHIQVENVVPSILLPFSIATLEIPEIKSTPNLVRFQNFHPPPIVKDIPVFVQSFLI